MKLSGHTLVEMLVVMVLISLIAVLSLNLIGMSMKFPIRKKPEGSDLSRIEALFIVKYDVLNASEILNQNGDLSLIIFSDTVDYKRVSEGFIRVRYRQDTIVLGKIVHHLDGMLSRQSTCCGVTVIPDSNAADTFKFFMLPQSPVFREQ